MEEKNSSIIIYQSEDGNTRIEVKLENETVWLTQQQLCDLYQTSRTNIVEHIQHIYEDGELEESATCRKFRQVRQEGSRMVERELPYYNLDMILSLGYRVRSRVGTKRAKALHTMMQHGATKNDKKGESPFLSPLPGGVASCAGL